MNSANNAFRIATRPRWFLLDAVDAHPSLSLAIFVACVAAVLAKLVLL